MSTTIDLTNYNALADDDGSNTVGTLWNKSKVATVILTPAQTAVTALDAVDATKAPLASPALTGVPTAPTAAVGISTTQLATTAFAAAAGGSAVSTVTTTGNITALPLPTGTGALVILMNNATISTIQGIAAGLSGQQLTLISMGAGQVDLAHQNASATAANRLINFATSGNTPLSPASGMAVLNYDATATRWRLVSHEQGAWITPTYAGGNFTGNGSMTWTVDSGDITLFRYRLSGRTLHVAFKIDTATIGGTVNTFLQISNAAYGGFAPFTTALYQMRLSLLNDSVLVEGNARADTAQLTIIKNSAANFILATNTMAVWLDSQFEVA